MNARERYQFLRHSERLLLWQIRQIEADRRARLIAIRIAHRSWRLQIAAICASNVAYYNRAIARGY